MWCNGIYTQLVFLCSGILTSTLQTHNKPQHVSVQYSTYPSDFSSQAFSVEGC